MLHQRLIPVDKNKEAKENRANKANNGRLTVEEQLTSLGKRAETIETILKLKGML